MLKLIKKNIAHTSSFYFVHSERKAYKRLIA